MDSKGDGRILEIRKISANSKSRFFKPRLREGQTVAVELLRQIHRYITPLGHCFMPHWVNFAPAGFTAPLTPKTQWIRLFPLGFWGQWEIGRASCRERV